MKKLVKVVCWIVVSPVLLLSVLLGLGGIGCAMLYGWATNFEDFIGYLLVGLCAEVIWLLLIAYLLM